MAASDSQKTGLLSCCRKALRLKAFWLAEHWRVKCGRYLLPVQAAEAGGKGTVLMHLHFVVHQLCTASVGNWPSPLQEHLLIRAMHARWQEDVVGHLISRIVLQQIEGRGNGIKTNTVNLVDISKALERPPDCASSLCSCRVSTADRQSALCTASLRCMLSTGTWSWGLQSRALTPPLAICADVLKFFGCELGAQTKYDKNSGTCIVNGVLQFLVFTYVVAKAACLSGRRQRHNLLVHQRPLI